MTPIPITITINHKGKCIGEIVTAKVPRSLAKKFQHARGDDYWLLHRLWVDAKHRGRGHARRLMDDLRRICNSRGMSLLLRVVPFEPGVKRKRLIEFYRQYGFRFIGDNNEVMERI